MTVVTPLACPLCRIALAPPETVCPRDGRAGEAVVWNTLPSALAKRFRVLEPFAHGSTGTMYLADESESGRRGLLKVLTGVPKHREPERARLRRELSKQTTLPSSHLIVPWANGETDGVTWLFRPWLDGLSLRVRLSRGERLPQAEALAISAQLAMALDDLHRGGLLHRDVKPNHVFLQTNSQGLTRAQLIDPGLGSPMVRPGNSTIFGTLGYVAPEQLQGKLVSFRSDLYSLGCVMYEMLAGHPPFAGETEQAVMAAQLSGELPPLPVDLPEGIVVVLRSLLAKEPQERPFSAQKLRRILDPYAPDGTLMTRPPTSTFGSLDDPEKATTAKPATPSLPPPPPPGVLRPPRAASVQPPPHPLTGRPTTRGVAPPPPPRPSQIPAADATQQLDLEQLEVIEQRAEATADSTQELSPEHLFDVARAPSAESAAAAKAARDDYTVPVRLDQILAIAPAKLRASAAPPPRPDAAPPVSSESALPSFDDDDSEVASEQRSARDDGALAQPHASIDEAPPAARAEPAPSVETHQTMFVEGEHEVVSASGYEDGAAAPQAAPGALFGALASAPEGATSLEDAFDRDPDDSGAVRTTVAARPAAPYAPHDRAAFAHHEAGDDETTQALPAPSALSPNTLDDSDDDGAVSHGFQDSLRPYVGASAGPQRKIIYGVAGAALLGLLVFGVKALVGGDEPAADGREAAQASSQPAALPPAPPPPEPPTPTVEPTPSVVALAAPPKTTTSPELAPASADAPAPRNAEAASDVQEAASSLRSPAEPRASTARDHDADLRRERREQAALKKSAEKQAKASAKAAEKQNKASAKAAEKQNKLAEKAKAEKKPSASGDRAAKSAAARDEARDLYAAGNFKQAAAAYERAIQYDPTNVKLFAGLGMSRTKLKDLKAAAVAYERAVQLSPSSSVYYLSLGRLYAATGEKGKAKAAYKRTLALDPKNAAVAKELKALGG